jgi:O-antigen ligase
MIVNKKKLSFFFFYTACLTFWLSIGSVPSNLINLNANIKEILNFFLIYTPLFTSILILIPFGLISFINDIKNKNLYKLHYLFIIFFLFQLFGLIFNNDLDFNFYNCYLAILGLGFTSLIILSEEFNDKKIFKNFLYISIAVLFSLTLVLIVLKFDTFLFTSDKYFYAYVVPNEKFIYQEMPRTTGLSRSLAILVLFFLCFIIWKLKSNFFIIFLSLACFLYVFLIYGMQSRGTALCYLATFLLLVLFTKNLNLKFKIFFLLFFLIIPSVTYESFLWIKKNKPELILNLKNFKAETKSKELINDSATDNRIFDTKQTASGRTFLWKEVIENYDLRKIFGYGPQADRFLIKSDKGTWLGNNSSNAIIYSFASGGYFCILIIFVIYSRGAYLLFKLFFVDKIFSNNNNIELKISCLFFAFFLIRSIFENSFALFSTDFILTVISISIIENHFTKKNLKKIYL